MQSRIQLPEVMIRASSRIDKILAQCGRTEDLHISPGGSRIALAGFTDNKVVVLEISKGNSAGVSDLVLSRMTEVKSTSIKEPHGVFWINDHELAVANRKASISIFAIPNPEHEVTRLNAKPIQSLTHYGDLVCTPGSVTGHHINEDFIELLVCNNYANTVTTHLLEKSNNYIPEKSVELIKKHLAIPDGVALSKDGQWLAISCHEDHSVYLYANNMALGTESDPQGVLRGVLYPHGLCFSPDNRNLLVADAGAPFVHHFISEDGQWNGNRYPVASLRVMDEKTYLRGRSCPGMGGPKGIDLLYNGNKAILACTTHGQALKLFKLECCDKSRKEFGPEEILCSSEVKTSCAAVHTVNRPSKKRTPLKRIMLHLKAKAYQISVTS